MCRQDEKGNHPEAECVHTCWCQTSAGALRFLYREGHGVPILALPGAAGRAEHLLLNSGSPFLALDWPGSGESTSAWPRCSTHGLAALVKEVIDTFACPQVVVLGHSLGAMVASHLALDPRVVGVVLLAPTPGLLPCLKAGIWPFPLLGILYLLVSALSLCNALAFREASMSDLNRAWLLHGPERGILDSEQWAAAERCSRPRAEAPSGALVWLQRRLGDIAALLAVLTYQMPHVQGQTILLLWGEQDMLIDSRASRLAADFLVAGDGEGSGGTEISSTNVRTAVSAGSGHFLQWAAPELLTQLLQDMLTERCAELEGTSKDGQVLSGDFEGCRSR